MKNLILSIVLLSFLSGCVTTKGPDLVTQDYETVVFSDGITVEEAIFIAKKELREKAGLEAFSIDTPKVVTEFESVKHNENFWFVSFPELEKSIVANVYMVSLRKENGKIVFSRPYLPDNEWVLEAVFLKLHEKE